MGSIREDVQFPSSSNSDTYLQTPVFDLFTLKGRVVVVTGGGRGIGLAMAFAAAEAGADVGIIDAAEEPHPDFYTLKARTKTRTVYCRSDVTDYDRLDSTFQKIVKVLGRIDGLITAAGICVDQPFLDRKPESVARSFDINVLGTYYSAQLAAKQMASQVPLQNSSQSGSIVLVASVAAYVSSKGQTTSDYCASKGAVVALSKALGVELAPAKIRVNSISPGYIQTDMTGKLIEEYPHLGSIMRTEPPMQRMGERVDLKGLVVYLLSNASAYQTSADVLVTGGIHAGRV